MKKFKFAFASLLLAVTMMAFSAATTQAQTTKWRVYNQTTPIANFLTDINTVTALPSWNSELSTEPICGSGSTFVCAIKYRVASGTMPTFGTNPSTSNTILGAIKTYFTSSPFPPFPGCGVEFSVNVPLSGGGTKQVFVTFLCKD